MDIEDIIVIIFGLIVVVGFGLMVMTLCSMGGDDCDTYENILANLWQKQLHLKTKLLCSRDFQEKKHLNLLKLLYLLVKGSNFDFKTFYRSNGNFLAENISVRICPIERSHRLT